MNDKRPRVLLVTRNLPPVVGGMERLIGHVAGTLCENFATIVTGPTGGALQPTPLARFDCAVSPPSRFLATAAAKSWWAARQYRPALVFAGSGLVAPIARMAARRSGAGYAVYLHGLDIAATHRLYRRAFVPAIVHADAVFANSHYTAARATAAGVPDERITVLPPGVDIPGSVPDKTDAARELRRRYDLPPGPILFGAGRLTRRKGFAAFVEQSLPAIVDSVPDARFIVAGEVPRHAAVGGRDEAKAIRMAAERAGLSEHVRLIGSLDDAGLALAWPAADVHVFPVQEDPGDPEGFGMVALEAAAWGVPTVAYATGGIPDAVRDGISGHLIPPGEPLAFAQAVRHLVADGTGKIEACRDFARAFEWPVFNRRLVREVSRLLRLD